MEKWGARALEMNLIEEISVGVDFRGNIRFQSIELIP